MKKPLTPEEKRAGIDHAQAVRLARIAEKKALSNESGETKEKKKVGRPKKEKATFEKKVTTEKMAKNSKEYRLMFGRYSVKEEKNIPIYEDIFNWMIDGITRTSIINKLRYKYSIPPYQGHWYFENAKKEMIDTSDIDLQYKRVIAVERYEMLYEKLVEQGDYKGAAQIQEKWVNLLGLDSPKEMNINIKHKPAEEMSIKEIELILNQNKMLEERNPDIKDAEYTEEN